MQSKQPFATAMRLFAHSKNYPVLVHCIHGKDRTGLIIMLLLLICDVPIKVRLATTFGTAEEVSQTVCASCLKIPKNFEAGSYSQGMDVQV